jgi:hypothetical protein
MPNVDAVLQQLKGFQRDTVEYAFRRLYLDADSTHRFLVADEVGLGKTLVARGVIAKTVEYLWDEVERVDVVYICSNSDIARQNVNRLRLPESSGFELASRITLLPTVLHDLEASKVNLVSFTPGTSFQLSGGGGVRDERVLLYSMLHEAWGFKSLAPPMNVFQGDVQTRRFRAAIRAFPKSGPNGGLPYDRSLADLFCQAVKERVERDQRSGQLDLRSRFEDLCERFGRARKHVPKDDRRSRDAFVGDLRSILARTCLQALEPDLVILDEFQRFRDLLDGDDSAAELARDLFSYADDSTAVRVLLLSATPYKMYTLSHELEEDDHYKDFLRTVRFLDARHPERQDLEALLKTYRSELYALGQGGGGRLSAVKDQVEAALRRVMSRTERLRVANAADGMLREVPVQDVELLPGDVRAFTQLQRVAREVGQSEVVEYWKSAPYLLNFMDSYKLKESFVECAEEGASRRELRRLLAELPELRLSSEDVERYQGRELAASVVASLGPLLRGRGRVRAGVA